MGLTLIQTTDAIPVPDPTGAHETLGAVLAMPCSAGEYKGQKIVTLHADGDGTSYLELTTAAPTVRAGIERLAEHLERVTAGLRKALVSMPGNT